MDPEKLSCGTELSYAHSFTPVGNLHGFSIGPIVPGADVPVILPVSDIISAPTRIIRTNHPSLYDPPPSMKPSSVSPPEQIKRRSTK